MKSPILPIQSYFPNWGWAKKNADQTNGLTKHKWTPGFHRQWVEKSGLGNQFLWGNLPIWTIWTWNFCMNRPNRPSILWCLVKILWWSVRSMDFFGFLWLETGGISQAQATQILWWPPCVSPRSQHTEKKSRGDVDVAIRTVWFIVIICVNISYC